MVVAILAILSAVLFPVFRSARASAHRVACIQNFASARLASGLYLNDYDDRFMMTSYQVAANRNSQNDRTWVQLILPYSREFSMFKCPGDFTERPRPETTFDLDLVPGDTYSRYYRASQRSNIGYNTMYLAPAVSIVQGTYLPQPRMASQASDPSNTLMFIDSVWSLAGGTPKGGGNYVVSPPCRYQAGTNADSFKAGNEADVYTANLSQWEMRNGDIKDFGGAWPWHTGRMNVARVDGSSKSVEPRHLTDGCEFGSRWSGLITDSGSYMWDLN